MEQIIQQYIQAKGLNEQQAQQLIQELQQLDEQQLQQVIGNMQQQLQGNNQEEQMMQYGGIPISMEGLYEYPNQKVVVPSNQITMKGIDYPVDAYNADTGEFLETMYPDEDYNFDANNVLEIPKGRFGISKMQSGGNRGKKGVRSLKELKKLKKSKNKKEQIAEGEDKAIEALKKFRKSLDTEEQIEDVIKKGDNSKYSGKFKKILRGTGGIFSTLFETSPWMQMFIQESSTSPTQKPTQEPIDKTTAFKLREQGFNVPDSLIEGYEKSSTTIPLKSNKQNNFVTNYFKQPESKYQLPSKFNISTKTPVQNQNISTSTNENRKKDEYSFVSDLSKVSEKSRKDNIEAYKSWTEEWNRVIPNFKSLPYNKQQEAVLNWMKANQSGLNYDNVIRQLKNWGYTQNPESLLKDGKFAEGTSLMRPSNFKNNKNLYDSLLGGTGYDTDYSNENPNVPIEEIPVKPPVLKDDFPKDEGVDTDDLDIQDVFLGKLDNRNYTGQFLKNALLKTMDTQPSYFGRVDLKAPSKIQKSLLPYLNPLYSAFNAQNQEIDENSSVGQLISIQNKANLFNTLGKVVSDVTNENLQLDKLYEDSLANIYNQQQQIDDQNRRLFVDDTMTTRANQQNMQLEFKKQLAEEMNRNVNRKNFFTLSNLQHSDIVFNPSKDNKSIDVIRKNKPFKADLDYYIEEMEKLKKENEKLKTKVAKYGIRKK